METLVGLGAAAIVIIALVVLVSKLRSKGKPGSGLGRPGDSDNIHHR